MYYIYLEYRYIVFYALLLSTQFRPMPVFMLICHPAQKCQKLEESRFEKFGGFRYPND